MTVGTYSSGLSADLLGDNRMLLWLLLLPLFHLLGFFPLNLQQGLGDSWLFGHTAPTRQFGLGLLSQLQGLLLLELQELLLLTSMLCGRRRKTLLSLNKHGIWLKDKNLSNRKCF